MKKGMFAGWKDVYSFTFAQNVKAKTFKYTFVGISLLLFVIFFAVNMITGYYKDNKKDKKDKVIDDVETMILINETSLDNDVFTGYKEYSEYIAETEIIIEDDVTLNEAKSRLENKSGVIVRIYKGENDEEGNINYMIDVYSTEGISKKDRSHIGNEISSYFDSVKYAMTNAEQSVINLAMSDVVSYGVYVDEDEESLAEILVKIFVPMIFVLVIYMMVLMHGQSISKSLISEKSSKLMETLLISVKPYAIIFGKILAMYTIAIMQMAMWIIAGIVGFIVGDKVAGQVFDNYSNPITNVMDIMKNGEGAFSAQAFIVAVIAFAAGFLFYCVLSAFLSSSITKAEELANVSGVYQMIVVIGFLAAYLLPLMQEESAIVKVLRYIPVTSAFMLPSDVIIGSIGIVGTILSVGILIVTTFIMIVITGRIYKKKVF